MVDNSRDWTREFAQSSVRDALAKIVDDSTPGLIARLGSDPRTYSELLVATNLVAEEAEELLRETVVSARHAGLNWEQIGDLIGMTRQAAQQRFSAVTPQNLAAEQAPVPGVGVAVSGTAIQQGAAIPGSPPIGTTATIDEASDDNVKMLNRAGQYGWRCVSFTTWTWTIEMTSQQWAAAATFRNPPAGDGWQRIGRYAHMVYWTRPAPAPPLPHSPNPEVFSSPKKFQKALDKQQRALFQPVVGAEVSTQAAPSLTGSIAAAIDKLADQL